MSKYVGFANLPSQVHRKTVKRGFEFTLMVVGESGLGKSTLINSLFLTDLYADRTVPSTKERITSTLEIETSCVEIEEQGIRLKLTVVDTPGFADSLDSSNCFQPIVNYVENQFENYLRDESGLNRRNIADNRVHCCFYFVNSSGHGLRPIDVKFMRLLHERVNVIPVIGKADTLTKRELQVLKQKVLAEIRSHNIKMYNFPDGDDEEDEDFVQLTKQLKAAVPMAVIGSNITTMKDGKKIRGRAYPWGVVNIEDPTHCDFIHLRTLLITFMQDMKEVTQEVHYENFRAQRLNTPMQGSPHPAAAHARTTAASGGGPRRGSSSAAVVMDDKDEMLKQKERELQQMQEMIARMQAQMQINNNSNNNNNNNNGNSEKTSTL